MITWGDLHSNTYTGLEHGLLDTLAHGFEEKYGFDFTVLENLRQLLRRIQRVHTDGDQTRPDYSQARHRMGEHVRQSDCNPSSRLQPLVDQPGRYRSTQIL